MYVLVADEQHIAIVKFTEERANHVGYDRIEDFVSRYFNEKLNKEEELMISRLICRLICRREKIMLFRSSSVFVPVCQNYLNIGQSILDAKGLSRAICNTCISDQPFQNQARKSQINIFVDSSCFHDCSVCF